MLMSPLAEPPSPPEPRQLLACERCRYSFSPTAAGRPRKFCPTCWAAVPPCGLCGKPFNAVWAYAWLSGRRSYGGITMAVGPHLCRGCRRLAKARYRSRCSRCDRVVYRSATSAATIVCQPCRRLESAPYADPAEAYQKKLDASRARRRQQKGASSPWDGVTDEAIYARDNWTCMVRNCLCPDGRAIDRNVDTGSWRKTIDHIIPLALGGSDRSDNKRAAHLLCNVKRSPSTEAWQNC